ncbi:MAG: hypothetical protein J6A57_03850 [Ruminococcus sp.]|nr:hypothetical protein [Ruminococcus sp.]
MKCKLCGAVYEEDNLYFCIGCGAMLKNPSTGEIVRENRVDDFEEENIAAENITQEETAVQEHNTTDEAPEILPEPEPPLIPEPELISEPPLIPEPELISEPTEKKETVFSSEQAEEKPLREPVKETPKEELFIEREREKTAANDNVQPVHQEQPSVVQPPEKSAKIGFGRLLGASAVALLSGILLTVVSLLFSLKLGFTGTNLHNIAEGLDKWSIINARLNGMSLSDNLYYETDFDKASHGFADKTEFALYLAGTDFTGFCADKLEAYADYIIDGVGDEPTVTENEIVDFFKNNHDRGTEIFGYEMQTADYNAIRSSLAENETSEKLSVGKIGWEIKFRLENIGYILSYVAIGIITALAIVLMIWINIILNGKGRYVLGYFGNIFTWSGLIVLLAAVGVSAGAALGYTITGSFICYLSSTLLLPTALYAACIGAILLAAGLIIKKVKSSIKVKEKIYKAAGKVN